MDDGVIWWSKTIKSGRESFGSEPGFSESKNVNGMVRKKFLENSRLVKVGRERRGRANIKTGEVKRRRIQNRSRIALDITGREEQ